MTTHDRIARLKLVGGLYRYHAPYGDDVCVYCGEYATTHDHVTPTGYVASLHDDIDTLRRKLGNGLITVPACKDCNTRLGTFIGHSVSHKREELKRRLRRKFSRLLGSYDWSDKEVEGLGRSLQSFVLAQESKRRLVERRLSFPSRMEATVLRTMADWS